MRFGVLAAVSAVILGGVILSSGPSSAQSGDLRGPREGPPPGFRGAQYVDSGGCVFVRAGISGSTTWVPRIGPDRRQLCGQPPSFGAPPPVAVAEVPPPPAARPAPAPAPAPVAAPTETRRAAAAETRPAPVEVGGRPAGRTTRGCPGHAPHGERLLLTDGTFALVCFRNAASVPGWAIRQGEARADCDPAAGGPAVQRRDGSRAALCAPAPQVARGEVAAHDLAAVAPPVPRGFKPAWTDGRLNPLRGKGTAAGQAQQDRIWTRDTPMRLVEGRARSAQPSVTMSASGAGGGVFVQVGSFAQPANADRARLRLAAMGLPVAQARAGAVQVVLAGPFGDAAAARAAQVQVRRSGFPDAFIR